MFKRDFLFCYFFNLWSYKNQMNILGPIGMNAAAEQRQKKIEMPVVESLKADDVICLWFEV